MKQEANEQVPKSKGKLGRPKLSAEDKASYNVGPYWLTAEEKRRFDQIYQQSGLNNQAKFFKHVLFEKPITLYYTDRNTDRFYTELMNIQRQINKIGNNTNQVAVRVDAAFSAYEVIQAVDQLKQMHEQLQILLETIGELAEKLAEENKSNRAR